MKIATAVIISLVCLLGFLPTKVAARDVPLFVGCNPDEYVAGPGSTDGTIDCEPKITTAQHAATATPVIGTVDKTKVPSLSLNDLVKNGVYIVVGIAGLIFFFMLILGGLKYLNSGGDEKATASARGTLTSAFIGLVIVVAAFLIAQLLFTIFGLQGVGIK